MRAQNWRPFERTERLSSELERRGFAVIPSRRNFLLATTPDAAHAGWLYAALKVRGVLRPVFRQARTEQQAAHHRRHTEENDAMLAALDARARSIAGARDRHDVTPRRLASRRTPAPQGQAADRPFGSCRARTAFTISSAVRVAGGKAAGDSPSGATRLPHRTSSAPNVSPPPKPASAAANRAVHAPCFKASTRLTGTVAALMLP